MRVSVIDVSKSYQGRGEILRSISLQIDASSFLSIIGPSGTGKTTLLKIIAGLEKPSAGNIFFDDADVTALPPQKRRLGFAFQVTTMFPHLSIRDNILLAMKTRGGVSRPQERLSYLLGLFKLERLAHSLPAQVSGGEARRASLAQMLSFQPPLLLLDEPFSDLDRPLVRELSDMLREWHRESKTTVIQVTHDVSAAWRLSDSVAILLGGTVRQCGTPREVYQNPASREVADFCGPMNWLKTSDLHPSEINGDLQQGSHPTIVGIRPTAIDLSSADDELHTWLVRELTFAGGHLDVLLTRHQVSLHVMPPVTMNGFLTSGMNVRIKVNASELVSFSSTE